MSKEFQRAEQMFYLYYQMGADRSIRKLHEMISKLGGKVGESTISRYSHKYSWQTRLAEIEQKAQLEREKELVDKTVEMNREEEQLGRTMEILASAGLKNWEDKIDADGKIELSISQISTLLEVGARHRRLALGVPTDRKEIAVTMLKPIIQKIANIFLQVNDIKDPERRKIEFGHQVDEMIEEHFSIGKA